MWDNEPIKFKGPYEVSVIIAHDGLTAEDIHPLWIYACQSCGAVISDQERHIQSAHPKPFQVVLD